MLNEQFFNEVGNHKLLTKKEEVELSRRAKAGDKFAKDQMVLSNLRLAIKIAKEFHNKSNCSLEDLIQESNVGLCKAVEMFDPERGFKFSTYASWWMKQRVRSYIVTFSGVARLPNNTRMIKWQAKKVSAEFEKEFDRTPTTEELSEALGISVGQLKGILACTKSAVNLDQPTARSGDGIGRLFHETIEDPYAVDPIEKLDRQKVLAAIYDGMSQLTEREEVILRLRFGLVDDLKGSAEFSADKLTLETEVTNDDA